MGTVIKSGLRDAFLISFVFYIVSNMFVFICTDMYQKSLFGLLQCYFYAIPFFVNRLSIYAFFCSLLVRVSFDPKSQDKKGVEEALETND